MRKLYIITGLMFFTLTACPQKKEQTFTELVKFEKGFMLNGKIYNDIPTGISSVTWELITGKPVTFLPSTHTHLWSDITNNPANQTLTEAIELMDGLPVSTKSAAEISKIIVPAGRARIVYNTTDSVLQVYYGGKWHILITDK